MGKIGEDMPAVDRVAGAPEEHHERAPDSTQEVAPSPLDSGMFATVDTPSARSQTLNDGHPPSMPSNSGEAISGGLRPVFGNRSTGRSGVVAAAASSGSSGAIAAFPVLTWDRYEFISLLGQGGMGAVYKARDRRIGRIVALKFIRGGDERLTQRFMQEARAQSRVDHPGICKVLEVGEVEGKVYIAMQLVDGPSLQEAKKTLAMLDKVSIVKEAAEAMHAAHELGIIHRDIKPANIMIERRSDGNYHPVIMDFGLARDTNESSGMTESGAVMGTAAFMSPEQARGSAKRLDRRTDVYSLGATLFDLLAGQPPFVADSMAEVLLKVMLEDPPSLRQQVSGIPEALDVVVGKSLNKEPSQRYATAKELADDLERYLNKRRIIGKRLSLVYRLRYRAARNKPLVAIGMALFVSLMFLLAYGIRTRIQTVRKERQSRQQAEIAQRLGQEITNMDWLLRSARQIPLHDLGREKTIMRKRMAQLQAELQTYGELSRGLGHYALGRGHMALHEYPEALTELQQSLAYGNQRAEVHYAFGFVLGKHYELAMYEARLAGGGDWAKKQLKEIEPKYLTPAIASLQLSRAMKLDAPEYLEGLIAYYKGDYDAALQHAAAAQEDAPWLYEAAKLVGDVHLQRGLQAMDRAKFEEAEKQLKGAVAGYESAAQIGQSDAEVYEGIAEAWVRLMAVAQQLGQPTKKGYAAVMSATDKINVAEPLNVAGPLKKAYATWLIMNTVDPVLPLPQAVAQCLTSTKSALAKQPGNPYATELESTCLAAAAVDAYLQGKDPEALHRQAITELEPVLAKYPHFLLGYKNMGVRYQDLAGHLQMHGDSGARGMMDKALEYFAKANSIDTSDASSVGYSLDTRTKILLLARSKAEIKEQLARLDEEFARCSVLIGQHISCDGNRLVAYARAAWRMYVAGEDPEPYLKRARESTAVLRKLDANYSETEQAVVLFHYVALAAKVREKKDFAAALAEFQEMLKRCLTLASQDPQCLALAAQAEWTVSDGNAEKPKLLAQGLKRALEKATQATAAPLSPPELWQVLAETNLRLAKLGKPRSKARDKAIAAGLAALEKTFAANPHYAAGRATQGALELLRTEGERDDALRQTAAQAAIKALKQALESDPLLEHDYAPLLKSAREVLAAL